MKNISFTSLRVRLMLLVLLVIIPMLGLIVYHGIEGRKQERLEALNGLQRLARTAAALGEHTIADARQLCFTLSQTPLFQKQDPGASAKILADLLKRTKKYNGLIAAKPNGEAFASAPSLAKPVSFADRPWFQRLVQTSSFVIGEYSIGRLSGKPTVVLGYPVLDPRGQLMMIFALGLDLDALQQTLLESALPDGANLNVIDSNGTVLIRYPNPEKFAGKKMPESSIIKTILIKKEGTAEEVGLDGVPRLFGYTTVGSGMEAIHINVGIPEQIAYANLKRRMIRDLTLLGLVSVLALLGAWFFGKRLIISPVNRLLDVTKRLADGDLTVRTGRASDTGELGLLASNFDRMAESLQQREEERKVAVERIGQLQEYLQLQIDRMPIGLIVWDTGFRITAWNPAAEKIFGFTAQEAMGEHPYILIVPKEAQPHVNDTWQRLIEGDTSAHSINDNITKDGRTIICQWSNTPLKGADGTVRGVLSMIQDITEYKRADEALRESEQRFRGYLEDAPDGIYMSDMKGNLLYGNRKCEEIIGYRREELIGKNFLELNILTGNSLNKAAQLLHTNIEGKSTGPDEIELISKKGHPIPVEINTSVVQLMGQGIVLGFVRDITDRKHAEEKLQQTLESLRKAVGTTIQVLAHTVETRDPYTAGHQTRSADLARAIATEMGLPQEKIDAIRIAGSIHDIGKLSIPAEILSKPTRLSEIEFSLIKEHSRKGFEMLKDVESPWPLAEIVYQHHERMDGSGYPRNLKGEDICIEARILAVADVVEAMASHRPYRPGLGIDMALDEIEKNRGIIYDNAVVDACLRLFREKGYQLAEA